MRNISKQEAIRLVNSPTLHWKHSFEVMPGVMTPGDWGAIDSAKLLDTVYAVPRDLTGLRALDLGTLDGVHAFELERRGASVTALDIQSPDVTGFNTAKRIIGSRVEYIQGSVYQLSSLLKDKYDIILFFGVWYHLKNPVRAFEEVANALASTGTLYAEGEALVDYVEVGGQPGSEKMQSLAKEMGESELPISVFYPNEWKGDLWSWYVPNRACVSAWLQTCGMKMLSHSWWADHPHQRLHVVAKKDPAIITTVDNPVW
jgi:tRNA (mo5U34)-methyltransferase